MTDFKETKNNLFTGALNNWECLIDIFLKISIVVIIATILFKIFILPSFTNKKMTVKPKSKSVNTELLNGDRNNNFREYSEGNNNNDISAYNINTETPITTATEVIITKEPKPNIKQIKKANKAEKKLQKKIIKEQEKIKKQALKEEKRRLKENVKQQKKQARLLNKNNQRNQEQKETEVEDTVTLKEIKE